MQTNNYNFNIDITSPIPCFNILQPVDQIVDDNSEMSRKRIGLHGDLEEPDIKKGKKELPDIPFYDMDELKIDLDKVEGISLDKRISSLGSLFKEVDNKTKQMWLETVKKTYLIVELSEGGFKSKSIHESSLDNSLGTNHYYLSLYDMDENEIINEQSKILSMRFSNKLHGELIWIQKGRTLTGNDVADLYHLFEKTILKGISGFTWYLYDDAKLDVKIGPKIEKMDLKLAMLSSSKSWYETKLGYSIAKVDNFKLEVEDKSKKGIFSVSQDPLTHEKALNVVQTLTIAECYSIYKKYKADADILTAIYKRAFGDDTNVTDSSKTLQELQKVVSEKARNNKKDLQATRDQFFLSNVVFKPYPKPPGKLSKQETEFLDNLNIINNTRILSKQF